MHSPLSITVLNSFTLTLTSSIYPQTHSHIAHLLTIYLLFARISSLSTRFHRFTKTTEPKKNPIAQPSVILAAIELPIASPVPMRPPLRLCKNFVAYPRSSFHLFPQRSFVSLAPVKETFVECFPIVSRKQHSFQARNLFCCNFSCCTGHFQRMVHCQR